MSQPLNRVEHSITESANGMGFKLVSEDVPKAKKRAYPHARAVELFLSEDADSARLDVPGAKPESLYTSLRRYVKRKGLPVKVIKRGDAVYLQRIREVRTLKSEGGEI